VGIGGEGSGQHPGPARRAGGASHGGEARHAASGWHGAEQPAAVEWLGLWPTGVTSTMAGYDIRQAVELP
jgi:hypothetical protein